MSMSKNSSQVLHIVVRKFDPIICGGIFYNLDIAINVAHKLIIITKHSSNSPSRITNYFNKKFPGKYNNFTEILKSKLGYSPLMYSWKLNSSDTDTDPFRKEGIDNIVDIITLNASSYIQFDRLCYGKKFFSKQNKLDMLNALEFGAEYHPSIFYLLKNSDYVFNIFYIFA